MRWATNLTDDGETRVGLVEAQTIRAVRGVGALIELHGDPDGLASAARAARRDPLEVIDVDDARLQAPVPVPPSIRDFMAFGEHVATTTRRRTGEAVDPGC